jgi:hypothetical protein
MYFKANVLVFVPTKKTTTTVTMMMMMSLCIIISISLFVIAHCGPIRLEGLTSTVVG